MPYPMQIWKGIPQNLAISWYKNSDIYVSILLESVEI